MFFLSPLVREKEDLDAGESFMPDMTHQVFGESEIIFGYKDPNITIAYMAGSLSTFVDIKYSEKIPQPISGGVKPDDILQSLKSVYPQGIYTKKSDFLGTFEEELKFKPFGSLRSSYTISRDGQSYEFVVYCVDHSSPDFGAFSNYLLRMEPFLLFFVDESSFVELDNRWSFYVLYEKFSSAGSPNERFAFAGYVSVYKFYAYPEHIRPRLSQMLILPPFQKMGHATRLLETVYEDLTPLTEVIDITVESPSDDLTRLRDYLDSKRCLELADCIKILKEVKESVKSAVRSTQTVSAADERGGDVEEGTPTSVKRRRLSVTPAETRSINAANNFYRVVQQQLKLSRTQSRRVYQILLFFLLTHQKPEAVEAYRKALLKRTRIVNGRPRLASSTFAPTMNRHNLITDLFNEEYEREVVQQVETELASYKKVAEKLEAAVGAGEVDLNWLETD
ncbi:unnamed protein product [Hydatigera taeniaeformis]|uniref:histone acetyltransferase n=1 Tax=Hydatigena taeniaeformis TaxID=6205 RepID=A0A0R3XB79_HYDTA|nr:unnamed protein product [Hydatigera taeniaeformis]